MKTNEAANLLLGLRALSSFMTRYDLGNMLGQSYGGKRNLYEVLGYPTTLTSADFWARYTRQDVAKRIVNAYPEATWRGRPRIVELQPATGEGSNATPFDTEWEALAARLNVFHYMERVDKLCGLGRFAVLLLGFSDGGELDAPVTMAKNMQLLYLVPYAERNVEVKKWMEDTKNPRYGLPETYTVTMGMPDGSSTNGIMQKTVHHTRLLHVAEGLLENDVYGTPRLEAVYNRLQDLDLVAGGSSEMFWRGAHPGMAFVADPDAEFNPEDQEALGEEIKKYIHGMQRYMKLRGVDAKQFDVQVADPSKHADLLLTLMSVASGIPKRILTGSERGELASSQDQENWNSRVDERRRSHAEPSMLRPFVDRLIEFGVLPAPGQKDGYTVEWPDIDTLSATEQADIAKKSAETLTTWANSGPAVAYMPPRSFYRNIMGFSEDTIDAIEKEAGSLAVEDIDPLGQEEEEDSTQDEFQDSSDEDSANEGE